MRLIDADRLKDIVEYACLQHEDTEKFAEWFKQVIDGEPTVCDIEQIRAEIEHEGAMFPDGEFFVSIDRINEIIDKYTKGEQE